MSACRQLGFVFGIERMKIFQQGNSIAERQQKGLKKVVLEM